MAAKKLLCNNQGIVIIEVIPIMLLFIMIVSYAVGMWGVVHTAVHNSMGVRAYAFSTFNQRTDLTVLRDTGSQPARWQFNEMGFRLHSVFPDDAIFVDGSPHLATRRTISLTESLDDLDNGPNPPPPAEVHNGNNATYVHGSGLDNRIGINPVWVKTTYGICLRSTCGP